MVSISLLKGVFGQTHIGFGGVVVFGCYGRLVTTDSLRQFLPMGHSAGFLQLHALVGVILLFKMDLLWPSMACLRLGMQL